MLGPVKVKVIEEYFRMLYFLFLFVYCILKMFLATILRWIKMMNENTASLCDILIHVAARWIYFLFRLFVNFQLGSFSSVD